MLKKLTPYAILPLSIACLGVFSFLIIDLSSTIEELAKTTITVKNEEINDELDFYFSPFVESIERTIDLGQAGFYDSLSLEEFNANFIPLLKNSKQISSLMLADDKGNEKLLLQLKNSWINRETFNGSKTLKPNMSEWVINGNTHQLKKEWIEAKSYDPRNRPWHQAAKKSSGQVTWTKPYQFFTTKDIGITASKEWTTPSGEKKVFAFDILLNDLSDFTNSLDVSENGIAFILTDDNRVLGLPEYSNYANKESFKLQLLKPLKEIGIPELTLSHDAWEKSGRGSTVYSFESSGKKWWGSISELKLGNIVYRTGVIAPEYDFLDQIKQFRLVLFGSLSLVLFFTLVIALISRRIRKTNQLLYKKNHKIKSQKQEIEKQRDYALQQKLIADQQKNLVQEKNKEITDSLNYATRIQNAIMPPINDLKRHLKDGFIFYQPKDIVAGDFYWLEHIQPENKDKKHVIFAVADCTGHGVPGALVSVVCSNALNRSVREYHLTDPGKILDKTRMLVINEFQKSDDNIKDGMDIALCSLERNDDNLILKYAGANNPLYIVRKSNQAAITSSTSLIRSYSFEYYTIYEIKANKQPIGLYDAQEPFTTHTITLQKEDTIYLFSDGFVDQFGGSKGKKFKAKAFRELLIKVQDLPMDKQKAFIEAIFHKWRGKMDQIDDVCILGIKIE